MQGIGRRRPSWILLWLTVVIALPLAGCAPASLLSVTPTPLLLSPAPPLPSPTLKPSPTTTPWPTISPAELEATTVTGIGALEIAAGPDRLICLIYEDTTADGQPEWLALTYREDISGPRLGALVFDGESSYPLIPVPPAPGAADIGFGQYPTCDVSVRDVNQNGVPEIAIFGYAEENRTLLHLFTWMGTGYRRLGFFSGDAGVKFTNVDGRLEEEIWEGYRISGAPDLVWYVVYTWEDDTYGWTSDHHAWYYADRPQTYPTHAPEYAVIAFYLALNDRDLPGAYQLLAAQARPDYQPWAVGYATTIRISVGGVQTRPMTSDETPARVVAMVTAWDNEGGVIVARLWSVEWNTTPTAEGWRLMGSTAELLETWTVPYRPGPE